MHILHTVLYTFPKVLTRRICLTIKRLFSWWSFPLFSWPSCVTQGRYCEEKLHASHTLGSNSSKEALSRNEKKTVHTLILAVWGTSILAVWSLNNWGGLAGMLHGGGAGPFTGLSIGWPDNTKILTNYSFIHLFALSRQADPFQHKSWFEWVACIDNNKAKTQH